MALPKPEAYRVYGLDSLGAPASWSFGASFDPTTSTVGFCYAEIYAPSDYCIWPPVEATIERDRFYDLCSDCLAEGRHIGDQARQELDDWYWSIQRKPAKVPALPPEVWKVTPFDPDLAMDAVRDLCGR